MYSARPFESVRGKRLSVRVVSVRGDVNFSARDFHDYGRMVKIAVCPAELNYVAYLEFAERNFFRKRSFAVVACEEVIKIFYARPACGAVVCGFVEPAEYRRVVHYACARINTLRGEVGAVSAKIFEVVIIRVAPESPFSCVRYGCLPVII